MTISVLVVEDHLMFAEALSAALIEEGDIEIKAVVGTAAEAIGALESSPVDVVLLDNRLPDITGMQLAPQLIQRFPQCRVIMLTAEGSEAVLSAAIAAGCVGYVNKTESVDQLVAAVRAAHAGNTAISPTMLSKLVGTGGSLRGQELTPRENQVLVLLAEGLGTAQIAESLFISTNTVRNHVQSIIEKLDAHSAREAVVQAQRQGLISPPPVS